MLIFLHLRYLFTEIFEEYASQTADETVHLFSFRESLSNMDIATFQSQIELLSFEVFKVLLKLKALKLKRIHLLEARVEIERIDRPPIVDEDWDADMP